MTQRSLAMAAVVLPAVAVLAAAAAQESPAPAPTTEVAGIPITLSRETTYFTGPLREDGTVDYLAAINAMQSEGVTPENNAAVLLLGAFGPDLLPPETRAQVLDSLGLPDVPAMGNRFVTLEAFARQHAARYELDVPAPSKQSDPGGKPSTSALADAIRERLRGAAEAPWAAEEDPLIADWLETNEQALGVIRLAVQRPRYWMPRYADGLPAMVSMRIEGLGLYREAGRALVSRAMLQLHEGHAEAAWEDLLTAHLLARHAASHPTLIDRLVGIAIDRAASQGDAQLATSGALSAEQARGAAQRLAALPPLPSVAEAVDLGERGFALDAVLHLARGGQGGPLLTRLTADLFAQELPWGDVLRQVNSWYDRCAAAADERDPQQREGRLAALDRDREALWQRLQSRDAGSSRSTILAPASADAQQRAQAAVDWTFVVFLPAHRRPLLCADAAAAQAAIAQTAYALAAHRTEHGEYPEALQALSPAYLPRVPIDPFSGQPLEYERIDGGYILGSAGGDPAWDVPDSLQPESLTVLGEP